MTAASVEPSPAVAVEPSPVEAVERLVAATNAHDLDSMVGCFSPDYVNETPAHPARGFAGREQVRVNWQHIFAAVPDLQVSILRVAASGDTVWTEWEMAGTRRDGMAHLMCGVILFGIADGLVQWARFYLEPVDRAAGDINAAVDEHVGPPR